MQLKIVYLKRVINLLSCEANLYMKAMSL